MPSVALCVTLLSHTQNPEDLVAIAARNCYSDLGAQELASREQNRQNSTYIRNVLSSGHASVAEHVQYTFGIEGVSRTLLAQITRHRIASFSVQSQRYVAMDDPEGFDYVLPPRIAQLGDAAIAQFDAQMQQMQAWYADWCTQLTQGEADKKGSLEDARFVLPGAAATSIVMTMNARELTHFLQLRMCNRAQWEIRALAWRIHTLVQPTAPTLFAYAGPACTHGTCPEGKLSCGKALDVRRAFAKEESK